jgi:hypothetical protein
VCRCLLDFLPEFSLFLLLRPIEDQLNWHTVALRQEREAFVCLGLLLHRVSMNPSELGIENLGVFVLSMPGMYFRFLSIYEHFVWDAPLPTLPNIRPEPS